MSLMCFWMAETFERVPNKACEHIQNKRGQTLRVTGLLTLGAPGVSQGNTPENREQKMSLMCFWMAETFERVPNKACEHIQNKRGQTLRMTGLVTLGPLRVS